MYPQVLLVICLFLSAVLSYPLNDTNTEENDSVNQPSEFLIRDNSQESQNIAKEISTTPAVQAKDDLSEQETFYPVGGVWWGVRPWYGWGGYRPWHGPHWGGHWSHRPWYGPHWNGHWGRR